jgi:hypothetical protein
MVFPAPAEYPYINDPIKGKSQKSQSDLKGSGQVFRVKHRKDVMFHKTAAIPGLSALQAEPCLQIGQGAYAPGKFNPKGPDHSRGMNPYKTRPPEQEKTAEHDKQNKEKMQDDCGIR